MFTGLIQAMGTVSERSANRLALSVPTGAWAEPIAIGESIAVNGCCLTVATLGSAVGFDLSEETLARTAFASLKPGTRVNLERALRVGDRLGGHFVQGHVDGVGMLVAREAFAGSEVFRFEIPEFGARYLIDKGSIAIDGISLTVVEPAGQGFSVAVIPETLRNTNLGLLSPGSAVNIEFDVLAKHVERLLRP